MFNIEDEVNSEHDTKRVVKEFSLGSLIYNHENLNKIQFKKCLDTEENGRIDSNIEQIKNFDVQNLIIKEKKV